MSLQNKVMSPTWLVLWAGLLGLAWLVPNHFPPWSAFHADAWMAVAMAIGLAAALFRIRSAVPWHGLTLLVALLVAVPWLQLLFGLLPFRGQAWMSSLYLLGFLLAMLLGAWWESNSPGQVTRALFLAIVVAAIVSVWLVLYTWLGLWDGGVMDIWSMGYGGNRPFANIGQPNQLATLLLWALVAGLWAYASGAIGAVGAVVLALFLLTGIALTQSRMALLALTAVLIVIWYWRGLWPSKRLVWAAPVLYLYFLACAPAMRWINAAVLGQDASSLRLAEQGDMRLAAWRLFAESVRDSPWVGYGWTELSAAQMATAERMPGLGLLFGHSHNLFLDLVLWSGLPLGLLLVAALLLWFWRRFRAVRSAHDAVLFMVVGIVGIHAMVELPLQYAYFLLPVGLIMGVLHVRLGATVVWQAPRYSLVLMWVIACLALGITIRDYFRVEASFNTLRFEQARIGLATTPTGKPPDVIALTPLREWIRLGRYTAHPDMSDEELAWMAAVTRTFPSAGTTYRLAAAMAMNGRPDEARSWLVRACRISDAQMCQVVRHTWDTESRSNAALAAVPWPLP